MNKTTWMEPLRPTPDCCLGWITVREALTWQSLRDYDGVWALPSLGGKSIRFCPCCGDSRVGVVWNAKQEAMDAA